MRRTETGVHKTMTEDISSTKTLGFGLTTATCVMTSGWSTKELISWLWRGQEEVAERAEGRTRVCSPRERAYGRWISIRGLSREEGPCGR